MFTRRENELLAHSVREVLTALSGTRRECDHVEEGVLMCGYETNEELEARMYRLQQNHPYLARITTIGQSVQGRKMTAITVSANSSDRVLGIPRFR